MGIFSRKKKTENRAEEETTDGLLLSSLFSTTTSATKYQALNIPSLSGGIDYIGNTVAMLPIKLYKEKDGKVEEVKGDNRVRLLNDDTGDTLDAVQFWKALTRDYFLGKGGYAYINKQKNKIVSLHYVKEEDVSIQKNTDPIFKDFDILVNAKPYKPFDFIKLLRNSDDGAKGKSLLAENPLIINVGYNTLTFEDNLVSKGGNKKGFLKSAKKLTTEAMTALKAAWKSLYSSTNEENVVILNDGLEFQESSNSSVEMQLNENKETNSTEICKLINVSESIIKGTASEKEHALSFKTAVMPLLRAIECALNKDLLLEKEKGSFYWAFDTKEMLKGDIKARYEAYKAGLDSNFLQIDEVRYMEDLPALGLSWIKLGLDTVLYNPKTHEVYTPNTNQTQNIQKGGGNSED
jgi:HK97 family phage portal protein